MPAQPGIFPVQYGSSLKIPAGEIEVNEGMSYPGRSRQISRTAAGPSRTHVGLVEDGKRDKKRKDMMGKAGKDFSDRRDDGRILADTLMTLTETGHQLSTQPDTFQAYNIRLYPLSIERAALLGQLEYDEANAIESSLLAFNEECSRVEEEYKKGREKVRERLMEGIEERRRKARDEKEGEGTVADASLDSQSRSHITRKLRNKLGTSPPPTPVPGSASMNGNVNPNQPVTTGPFHNPHSLSVDDIPSPFPLTLISGSSATNNGSGSGAGGGGGGAPSGRRRPKGSGTNQSQAIGGLGKSLAALSGCKEAEIDADLGTIRRHNKRRRGAVGSMTLPR